MTHFKRTHILALAVAFLTLILYVSKGVCTSNTILLKEIQFISINNQAQIKKVENSIANLTNLKQVGKKEQLSLVRLIDRRQELILRHDFINRLTRHVDNRYTNQPQMNFLIKQLSNMAQNEAKSDFPNKQFLTFIMNCRQVLIDRPPEQHNPVELIERYMKFTQISKNTTSAAFYKESDYSNRSESYTARDISFQEVGEKINILDHKSIKNKVKPENIDIYPKKSDQELVNKKIFLQEQLRNNSATVDQLKKPLNKPQALNKKKLKKFMNLEEFKTLFNK